MAALSPNSIARAKLAASEIVGIGARTMLLMVTLGNFAHSSKLAIAGEVLDRDRTDETWARGLCAMMVHLGVAESYLKDFERHAVKDAMGNGDSPVFGMVATILREEIAREAGFRG